MVRKRSSSILGGVLLGAAASLCLLALAGCHSTYSAPVRTGSFGAPANLGRGEGEVGLTAGVTFPDEPSARIFGGPVVAVGATDWLAFELGGEWVMEQSASGFGALRFTLEGRRGRVPFLDVDLTLGGGAGVGGVVCDNRSYEGVDEGLGTLATEVRCPGGVEWDGLIWQERINAGGYLELGLGLPLKNYRLVPYARLRFQATDGEGLPWTAWGSVMGGAHFNLQSNIRFHLELGLMFYHNEIDPLEEETFDAHANLIINLGLSFGIPTDRGIIEVSPDAADPPGNALF